MDVSVIIPVKNDKRIIKTLNGLATQNFNKNFEIVVVDASAGKLDYIKNLFKHNVRWIDFKVTNLKKRTTVSQVNFGVRHAKGNVIAFIDADCIPDKNWLSELVKPIFSENESFTAGYIRPLDSSKHHDDTWVLFAKQKYIAYCPNMNSAIKKDVIVKVGYFDEYTFNYGWDMDFAWRATKSGIKIRFVKEAQITHDWGDRNSEIKRYYNYGIAKVRLLQKNSYKIRYLIAEDPYLVKYVIIILSMPIIIIFPVYSVVILYWLAKDWIAGKSYINVIRNFSYGLGALRGVSEIALRPIFKT